jgi:predicted enzyme related to lactoylglutathione lyase
MPNPFVHIELNTLDLDQAKGFYGALFDWTLKELALPNGTYVSIAVGGGTGGGMRIHPVAGAPSEWLPYVLVKDMDAAIEKARSLGATVIEEPTQIPDVGWMSIIRDPTGAALGLWKYLD